MGKIDNHRLNEGNYRRSQIEDRTLLVPNRFSTALTRIYDSAYSSKSWGGALDECKDLTLAKHAFLYAIPQSGEIEWSEQSGSNSMRPLAPQFEEYNRLFNHPDNTGYDDVGLAFMQVSDFGKPVLDTDIWDIDWLHNRPEVQFMRGMGVFRKIYVNLSQDPLVNSGIMFWYDKDLDQIPHADISTSRLMAPHLTKALEISRWADGLRSKYSAVLSVLDHIEIGVCLADENGNIILHNKYAGELFSQDDGVRLANNQRLSVRDSDIGAKIAQAITDVSLTSQGENRVSSVEITLPRINSSNPLVMIASPLRDANMELEANLTGCLLTIIDTDRTGDLRLDSFGEAYGFTPMEKKSAALLVSGLTTPEVAEELGVATSTAQSHVKSVYQKTRSNNRVSFVWKAIQFSPPVT